METPIYYASEEGHVTTASAAVEDWTLQRATRHLRQSARVIEATITDCRVQIVTAARLVADTIHAGNKLLLCGNGGSAADCQHLATEFTSRLTQDFARPAMAAISLVTDTSFLTAFANDCGFDGVFARQVEALGRPGDLLLGISTSGNSRNVVLAVEAARERGIKSITLCGRGGQLAQLCDAAVRVPSSHTPHIQEAHLAVEHVLCDLVERMLYGDSAATVVA